MRDFSTLDAYGIAGRGDLFEDDGEGPPPEPKARPVAAPRLEGQPEFPAPGIYFGMPEEEYHAIHACSTSGMKRMGVSSMDYWEGSPMNPDPDTEQNDYLDYGKAIHTFVLEGEEAYGERYAVGLDKAEHPDALVTSDDIITAIAKAGGTPVTRIDTGETKPSPIKADPLRMAPVTRAARKDDLIAQLLEINPTAKVWDAMAADHLEEHRNACMISAKADRRIRVSAHMILHHPDIGRVFRSGFPEVSLFWYCPRTGAPMKMRTDWLDVDRITDLKSFTVRNGKPINRAIENVVAAYRYNIQHAIYVDGVVQVREVVRESGGEAIFGATDAQRDFAMEWAAQREPPRFLFVFQKSGPAPVTRGRYMPRGFLFSTTAAIVDELKRQFITCAEVYDTDPWLDIEPIEDFDEDRIPSYACDIGKIDI